MGLRPGRPPHLRSLGARGKVGDRFAALQLVYDAVIDRHGVLAADVARGLDLRHDRGSQYRSGHFTGSLAWFGITDSPAFPGEPECNGCAERWIKTLKEQCLWARTYRNIDDLRRLSPPSSSSTTPSG